MKIIKYGKIPEKKLPWWVDIELACYNCKTVFVLDKDDVVSGMIEKSPHGKRIIAVDCPVCKQTISKTWLNSDCL